MQSDKSRIAKIRAAIPEDASVVREVIISMLTDSPSAFGESLAGAQSRTPEEWQELVEYMTAPPMRTAFLALDEGGVCGFVCADAAFPEAPPDSVLVSRLWVAPHQRGSGVGRALMETATKWARGRHAGFVALGVTEMNTSAIAFYRHLGYKDIGIRTPWPPDPRKQIIILGKELKS